MLVLNWHVAICHKNKNKQQQATRSSFKKQEAQNRQSSGHQAISKKELRAPFKTQEEREEPAPASAASSHSATATAATATTVHDLHVHVQRAAMMGDG
jgi:hypothetical protein